MASRPGPEISLPLRVAFLPACPDGHSTIPCLKCTGTLEIHQPDAEVPDRMMATCPACRSWHLIDCGPGPIAALIVLLPDLVPLWEGRAAGGPASLVPGPWPAGEGRAER